MQYPSRREVLTIKSRLVLIDIKDLKILDIEILFLELLIIAKYDVCRSNE